MGRFVEGEDRRQQTMLPGCLDGCLAEDNPVRAVDAIINEVDLFALGFERVQPAASRLSSGDASENQPHSIEPAIGA